MAVVRLHDAWARFCRELIILSALGRTVTLSGVPLAPSSPALANRNSVIAALLATYKKKKYEPRWSDAVECLDAAARLKIANLPTVSAGLSASNSPADEIRQVRNFYAHRRMESAIRALATKAFSHPTRPVASDLASFTTGGDRIIESWVRRLIVVGTVSAQ
jgi:hypothetical protein